MADDKDSPPGFIKQLEEKFGSAPHVPQGSQLPLLPDGVAGIPHDVARSSIFTANKPGRKQIYELEAMGPPSNEGQLLYSGHELNQSDMDVVLEVFRRYGGQTGGEPLKFTRNSLLQSMGKGNGNSQYKWLMGSLDRLSFAMLKIDARRYVGTAGILKYDYNPATEEYTIRIDPRAVQFLNASHLAFVDVEKRRQLPPKDYLAKQLQIMIDSHERGTERWASYKELKRTARQVGRLTDFKNRALPRAFEHLKQAGIIAKYRLEENRAFWVRA